MPCGMVLVYKQVGLSRLLHRCYVLRQALYLLCNYKKNKSNKLAAWFKHTFDVYIFNTFLGKQKIDLPRAAAKVIVFIV